MGSQIPGTELYYTGDVKDVIHGREDPQKFVRLFEPRAAEVGKPVDEKAFYFPPEWFKIEKTSKLNRLINWLTRR